MQLITATVIILYLLLSIIYISSFLPSRCPEIVAKSHHVSAYMSAVVGGWWLKDYVAIVTHNSETLRPFVYVCMCMKILVLFVWVLHVFLSSVPDDLSPEERQELESIRRRKQELLHDIQVTCFHKRSHIFFSFNQFVAEFFWVCLFSVCLSVFTVT